MQPNHVKFLMGLDPQSQNEPRYTLDQLQDAVRATAVDAEKALKPRLMWSGVIGALFALMIAPTIFPLMGPFFSLCTICVLTAVVIHMNEKWKEWFTKWMRKGKKNDANNNSGSSETD